jgi:hypothetical protein
MRSGCGDFLNSGNSWVSFLEKHFHEFAPLTGEIPKWSRQHYPDVFG